jgi:hypothetical protein
LGGLWQRREITAGGGYLSGDSPILNFGLGDHLIVDFIRSVWPSGVRGAQPSFADSYVQLAEPEGEIPSCPFLYVWNGKRFDLIADLIAGGTIGELVSTNHYLPLDPDEYIKIDSDRVRAVGGDYRFSLVNQLPETDYIEQARLFAVDHPADVDVYPNERLLTGPPYPKFKVWAISKSRLPVSAVDGTGQDVLNRIVSRDGVYHADLHPLRWRGFAQRHSVTLDLGSLSQTSGPVLLLHGYTAWGGSSTALGAGQAGVLYETPRLEVRGKNGRWQTAIADMGIPAGLPRTITVPLSGVFPTSDHHVRISTNMKIYWDEIRVGFAGSDNRYQPLEVPLVSAQLQRIGYPRRIRTDPAGYDYYDRSPSRDFPVHHGKFTRYGEVRELLANRDDKLAIMNHGEEIQLRFAADGLPKPRRGWKRDFMFYLYGYDKSNDVNSAHSFTVNPLPFFKMSSYPYGADERYPMDRKHLKYLMEYNTREW